MRLFIGIDLPDAVRRAALDRIAELRARVERAAPRGAMRWVSPGNLHVTIWFLGEVPEATVPQVAAALGGPYRQASFRLEPGAADLFPSATRPRVISVGMASGAEKLGALHREVGERLVPHGFVPEHREYSAHLTLARIKELRPAERRAVHTALARPLAPFEAFDVTALTLFRSRLSPHGARYESLLRVPLR